VDRLWCIIDSILDKWVLSMPIIMKGERKAHCNEFRVSFQVSALIVKT